MTADSNDVSESFCGVVGNADIRALPNWNPNVSDDMDYTAGGIDLPFGLNDTEYFCQYYI